MPFQIIRNDITKVRADAIVNTANPEPVYAAGTDCAVYQAAGEEKLLAERKKIGRIGTGEAAVTPAFRLHARYIIHTVGPVWVDGDHREYELLASCYRKSLLLARQLGCRSIAFPLISTGVYGFPKDRALDIALEQISAFLGQTEENEEEMNVLLVVFDKKAFDLSAELVDDVRQYIDEKYVKERRAQEYEAAEYDIEERRRGRAGALREQTGFFGRNRTARERRAEEREPADRENSSDRTGQADRENSSGRTGWADGLPGKEPLNRPVMTGSVPFPASADGLSGNLLSAAEQESPYGAPGAVPEETESAGYPPVYGSSGAAWKNTGAPALPQRSLEDVMSHVGETFQECLLRLIDERGMTDAQVYKRANIDRKLFSKIRCNVAYSPKRRTAISLAIALRLNMDETTDLLRKAGIALSPGSKFDLIICYCLENGIYDIFKINALLFDYEQPLLGA